MKFSNCLFVRSLMAYLETNIFLFNLTIVNIDKALYLFKSELENFIANFSNNLLLYFALSFSFCWYF